MAATASISPMCVVTWITRSFGVGQHHRVVGHPGQLREQLGVARVAVPGEVERLLVERRGADGVDLARLGERHRALDRPERALARLRRQLAEGQVGVDPADVDAGDRTLRHRVGGPLDGHDVDLDPEHRRRAAQALGVADHHASGNGSSPVSAPTMISGPIPAASPIVMAIGMRSAP